MVLANHRVRNAASLCCAAILLWTTNTVQAESLDTADGTSSSGVLQMSSTGGTLTKSPGSTMSWEAGKVIPATGTFSGSVEFVSGGALAVSSGSTMTLVGSNRIPDYSTISKTAELVSGSALAVSSGCIVKQGIGNVIPTTGTFSGSTDLAFTVSPDRTLSLVNVNAIPNNDVLSRTVTLGQGGTITALPSGTLSLVNVNPIATCNISSGLLLLDRSGTRNLVWQGDVLLGTAPISSDGTITLTGGNVVSTVAGGLIPSTIVDYAGAPLTIAGSTIIVDGGSGLVVGDSLTIKKDFVPTLTFGNPPHILISGPLQGEMSVVVPEPGTLLLLLAAAAVGFSFRPRKRAA